MTSMLAAFGLAVTCALVVRPALSRKGESAPLFRATGGHWRRGYGRRSFLRLGMALVGAGLMAFSGADEAVESFHAGTVRSRGTDFLSDRVRLWGERFWFFVWLLVAGVDAWIRTSPFSRWGRSNFEAMCVGLPVLWTLQRGLGSNRPSSEDASPRWRPLRHAHGASGHAFMAAIPWLTLARRHGGGVVAPLSRAASLLTGWSRINDRKHYLSQVVLGWVAAWNAVDAVNPGLAASPDETRDGNGKDRDDRPS